MVSVFKVVIACVAASYVFFSSQVTVQGHWLKPGKPRPHLQLPCGDFHLLHHLHHYHCFLYDEHLCRFCDRHISGTRRERVQKLWTRQEPGQSHHVLKMVAFGQNLFVFVTRNLDHFMHLRELTLCIMLNTENSYMYFHKFLKRFIFLVERYNHTPLDS